MPPRPFAPLLLLLTAACTAAPDADPDDTDLDDPAVVARIMLLARKRLASLDSSRRAAVAGPRGAAANGATHTFRRR